MSAAASAPARFSTADSLVDVDASLPLSVIARQCQEAGWLFPLPGPLPSLSLAAACARMPFLVDAYVASAEAVTAAGLAFGTGRAPRSATGPDLLGALCSSPPLATCVRARVRVLAVTNARASDARHDDVDAALAALGRLLDEGRAFAALALRSGSGYRVCAIGGPAALPSGAPATGDDFTDDALGRVAGAKAPSSRSLVPGDRATLRARLTAGAPLVAAPFMGRVAAFLDDEPKPIAAGGAAAFASALARAGARHG